MGLAQREQPGLRIGLVGIGAFGFPGGLWMGCVPLAQHGTRFGVADDYASEG